MDYERSNECRERVKRIYSCALIVIKAKSTEFSWKYRTVLLQRIMPSAADPNELREKLNVRRLGRTKLTLLFAAPSSAVFEKRKISQNQGQK